jgi:hypothetical protein
METNIIMMFLRVIKIPRIPKKNIRVEKINKKNILKLVITTQYKNYLTKTLLKVWACKKGTITANEKK